MNAWINPKGAALDVAKGQHALMAREIVGRKYRGADPIRVMFERGWIRVSAPELRSTHVGIQLVRPPRPKAQTYFARLSKIVTDMIADGLGVVVDVKDAGVWQHWPTEPGILNDLYRLLYPEKKRVKTYRRRKVKTVR